MRNILLRVAYDGSAYSGWQEQPNAPSVSEALKAAIYAVTGESSDLAGSGRTDAGVHALGQAASFHTNCAIPAGKLPLALNTKLPRDIRVMSATDVSEGFHARYSAVSKEYLYIIDLSEIQNPLIYSRAWHFGRGLDIGKMQQGAQAIVGSHDFKAFMSVGSNQKTTVRTVLKAEAKQQGSFISLRFSANGFLYNMARIFAGSLASVGSGKLALGAFANSLESGIRLKEAITAPACGLYLASVCYSAEALEI
ncbi:MAG: tRNA pseudouridine(38-40) synthase TruA [Eubacteriaceae bacterium]|nr:tRNA pseudouridine(38-40) synthase TruA [Eubacteriaceae bacterium]